MSYFVFSDVDETLIKFKSTLVFMSEFLFSSDYAKKNDFSDKQREFDTIVKLNKDSRNSREILNRRFYSIFEGVPQSVLQKFSYHWIQSKIDNEDLFIDETLKAHQEHQKKGAKLILISGSFPEVLKPIQEYVKAEHLICSELEVKDGIYTGRLLKQVIGEEKWNSILDYISGRNIELSSCYAYGDHESDVCFMEKVGYPVLVGGRHDMKEYARKNNWAMIYT